MSFLHFWVKKWNFGQKSTTQIPILDAFQTTLFYAERIQIPVAVIAKQLDKIAISSMHNQNAVQNGFTDDLLKLWYWMLHASPHETEPYKISLKDQKKDPVILHALKHFAANLIKGMLHKKETTEEAKKYFAKYKSVEEELNNILANLNHELGKKREEDYSVPDDKMFMEILVNNEMLAHLEDVVQIDWKTAEGTVGISRIKFHLIR